MSARRVDGAKRLGAPPGSSLVIIGNFDGVHRGHQAALAACAEGARERSLAPVVLTFDPHPARALGRAATPVLTTLERKLELIGRVDPAFTVVVEPFDRELAGRKPAEFAEELLATALGARAVLVGHNFRFGRERSGDLSTLVALGKNLGFDVQAEPLHGDEHGPFSSTRVRAALAAGDLAAVHAGLGRPHALSGRVVHGDGRGRSIGVPTANLTHVVEALPPYGVYACLVDRVDGGVPRALAAGVANVGERPTVNAGFAVEVHLFDFDEDLYDAELRLHLTARLREERRFADLSALRAQMNDDFSRARAATAGSSPRADGAWS